MISFDDSHNFFEISLTAKRFFNIINLAISVQSEKDIAGLIPNNLLLVTKIMGAENTTLYILNQKSGELWMLAESSKDTTTLEDNRNKALAASVILAGKCLIIPDVTKNPNFGFNIENGLGTKLKNMIFFIIRANDGTPKGVLQITNFDVNNINQSEMAIIDACTSLIGLSIETIENKMMRDSFLKK
jgi:transcriptional regulator with GAF, ATPase, and Fis domain